MTSVGVKFFDEPSSSPRELGVAEQPHVSVATSSSAGVLNKATVNSLLPAALEQFEDQATSRLLLFALEGYEDSGTTQKEDTKKTPAKMSTKSRIVASISVGLPENCQLVQVLSLRTIGGDRVQYLVIYAVFSRLNCCNSFSHYLAIVVEDRQKERKKSEDRRFARFSDLPVWYFSNAFQLS